MKVLDLFEAKAKSAFDRWAAGVAADNRAKKKAIDDREREYRIAMKKLDQIDKARNAKSTLTTQQIWTKVETVIGNTFPDGDPIDHLIPWMDRNNVSMDQINAAVKKHAKEKDMYAYLASMWDDMAGDSVYDANQQLSKGQILERNPFIDVKGEKAVNAKNPWK